MTWEDNRRGASTEDGFIIADGVPTNLIPRNIHWHDNYMHSFTEDGVKIANLKKAITNVSSLPEEGDTEVFYRLAPGDATHKAGIYYWDGERYVYDDALGLVTEHNTSETSHADIRNAIQAMSTDMKYKGSVDDFEHLPVDAKKGDVYTTRNDGKEYVFDGEMWVELGRVVDVRWGGITGDIEDQEDLQEALAEKEDARAYSSLERNGEYLYTVTFNELPEYEPASDSEIPSACSSFVRDGKLYRNLDWNYDNSLSFRVITKDFEGIAFDSEVTSENLDKKKVEQLPYHVVDGVNKNGIMVSTHVLYNDWSWAGTGSINLNTLPYEVLSKVKSMATIATDLASVLTNLYVPESFGEYLIQLLVTDGTTTYVIAPSTTSGMYDLINATSNPKLTNFRWSSDATVVRTDLQTRPTGVERWNLIDNNTELKDLRFTLAYEAPTRLSEFIGIAGTTKDSTDAELTAIYNEAHAEYEDRERDGKTWQTMHSVVYSANGIENLYVQENWNKDYIPMEASQGKVLEDTIDARVPAPTAADADKFLKGNGTWAEVQAGPTVVQATGTSTTDVMSQKATTNMVYANKDSKEGILIGNNASTKHNTSITIGDFAKGNQNAVLVGDGNGYNYAQVSLSACGFGYFTKALGWNDVCVGIGAQTPSANSATNRVTIGAYSTATQVGEFSIGNPNNTYGYNGTGYRLLTNVYDGQSAHDGATFGQVISYSGINGVSAPTTATEAKYVGQIYVDTTANKPYYCSAITAQGTTPETYTYTWNELGGGGGVNVVQTTGASTTDVMSQDAVTKMVYDGGNIRIGNSASATQISTIAIGQGALAGGGNFRNYATAVGNGAKADSSEASSFGSNATASFQSGTAVGANARSLAKQSVAIGSYSSASAQGEFSIGGSNLGTNGYNGTSYRKITNVYDGENAHDACTKGQLDAAVGNIETAINEIRGVE